MYPPSCVITQPPYLIPPDPPISDPRCTYLSPRASTTPPRCAAETDSPKSALFCTSISPLSGTHPPGVPSKQLINPALPSALWTLNDHESSRHRQAPAPVRRRLRGRGVGVSFGSSGETDLVKEAGVPALATSPKRLSITFQNTRLTAAHSTAHQPGRTASEQDVSLPICTGGTPMFRLFRKHANARRIAAAFLLSATGRRDLQP